MPPEQLVHNRRLLNGIKATLKISGKSGYQFWLLRSLPDSMISTTLSMYWTTLKSDLDEYCEGGRDAPQAKVVGWRKTIPSADIGVLKAERLLRALVSGEQIPPRRSYLDRRSGNV